MYSFSDKNDSQQHSRSSDQNGNNWIEHFLYLSLVLIPQYMKHSMMYYLSTSVRYCHPNVTEITIHAYMAVRQHVLSGSQLFNNMAMWVIRMKDNQKVLFQWHKDRRISPHKNVLKEPRWEKYALQLHKGSKSNLNNVYYSQVLQISPRLSYHDPGTLVQLASQCWVVSIVLL